MSLKDAGKYSFTTVLWPEDGFIEVFGNDNSRIALLSIEFMKRGGVYSWEYVEYCLGCCCTFEAGVDRRALYRIIETGTLQQREELGPLPLPGRYRIEARYTLSVGPRFHYRHRGPDEEHDHSTMSASSTRSTARQTNFRFSLAVRDGFCIVSEEDRPVAAHILPQSRPEYYEEVLGYQPENLFEVSYGIFVSPILHHSFDRGEWSLMPDPEDSDALIVHVFYGHLQAKWHGKRISRARFRIAHPSQLPHRGLLAFHYRQCVVKHVRGYGYFT